MAKKGIKIVVVAAFVYLFILFGLIGGSGTTVQARQDGPDPGFSGAPGEFNCTACHGGFPNEGPGTLTVVAPASYEPGQTYDITVRHNTDDTSRRRWGFQLTVLGPANTRAGTLQSANATTQVIEGGGALNRQYIEHTLGGTFQGQTTPGSWTFRWTAPNSNVGPITFWAAGNQANNNSQSDGDQIYTTRVIVTPAGGGGPPMITRIIAGKKHLFVEGEGFVNGSVILIDDIERPTLLDEANPTTSLIGKKLVKKGIVPVGVPLTVAVRNPDGQVSEAVGFTRE